MAEVEALLLVPIAAHALFARPFVTSPSSVLAVEICPTAGREAVLWCDGRRRVPLPPGPGSRCPFGPPGPVGRLVRAPFTDRLVAKFGLPVRGLRVPERVPGTPNRTGHRPSSPNRRLPPPPDLPAVPPPVARPAAAVAACVFALPGSRHQALSCGVLLEMRLRGLGVIRDAVLEFGPGLTVVTGDTGPGKPWW